MSERLDSALVSQGLVPSRERAKELIKSGNVTVNGKTQSKPSINVTAEDKLEVIGGQLKYVGRAGLKLEKAAKVFDISFKDKVCADIGASTGGFTDFMLQNGSIKVYAVDVGHDQLAQKLRDDARVVNMEGTNVKELCEGFFDENIDIMTADLSFISLKTALVPMLSSVNAGTMLVLLIKPQFEAGKKNIGKGGIVKDRKVHINVLRDMVSFFAQLNCTVHGLTCSGIKGGDGNIEYLALITKDEQATVFTADIPQLVDMAFKSLK